MENYQPAKLLRLHITERDRFGGKPLYEAIVEKCRELEIAGATVFRGVEGFGDSADLHRARLLGQDLPIVIQIVDSEENVGRILSAAGDMMDHGLIAISDVRMRRIQKAAAAR